MTKADRLRRRFSQESEDNRESEVDARFQMTTAEAER